MINTFFKKLKSTSRFELFLYSVVIVIVLYKGLLFERDSYAFLDMEINRSPGYLLFLSLLKKLFGAYFEYPLLSTQLLFNLYGIHVLHKCLNSVLKLRSLFSFLTLLLLLAPLVYLYFTANKIMSEALCYPLYLIFTAHSIYAFIGQKKKNLLYAAVVLLFLIFIRGQFLCLIPISLLLTGYLLFVDKGKEYVLIGLFFIAIPFITNLMDKSFHYFQYDYFVATPFTGPSLAASVFYVADHEDSALFGTEEEKIYFKRVMDRLESQNWNSEYALRSKGKVDLSAWFRVNYSNICNQTIHEYGMIYHREKGFSSPMQYIATNELILKMYQPLLLDNFKMWVKLYIGNIKASLGNSKYLLIHLILLGIGLLLMIKYQQDIGKLIVFIISCVLANITLLAIATHVDKRYVFYTDWVLFIILFLFIDQYLKKLPKNGD